MIVKTILVTLLIISLAFNVFFVLGSVQISKEPDKSRSFEDRAHRIAEKLQLDQQQYERFEQFLARFNELRQANASRREEFFDELLKPDPDQKLLKDFYVGSAALEYRLARLAVMQEFIEMLSPQQRDMFVQMIGNRRSSSSDTQKTQSE